MDHLRTAERLLREIRAGKKDAHEAQTSEFVHLVLCDLAGWPRHRLRPEKNCRGRVDYSLDVRRVDRVVVEVKKHRRPLDEGMVTKYLSARGRPGQLQLGILTNGEEWQLWAYGSALRALGLRPQLVWIRSSNDSVGRLRLDRIAELLTFPRFIDEARRTLAETPEVLDGVLATSETVERAYRSRFEKLFEGRAPPLRSVLALMATANGRVPAFCLPPMLACRGSNVVVRVLDRECRRILRRGPGVKGSREHIHSTFKLPGEHLWEGARRRRRR
jgi:hypothetical protein